MRKHKFNRSPVIEDECVCGEISSNSIHSFTRSKIAVWATIGEQILTKEQTKELKNGGAYLIPNKNPAAITLGTLGGKAKSRKKALSSKENGKKGGRPKKHTELYTGKERKQ